MNMKYISLGLDLTTKTATKKRRCSHLHTLTFFPHTHQNTTRSRTTTTTKPKQANKKRRCHRLLLRINRASEMRVPHPLVARPRRHRKKRTSTSIPPAWQVRYGIISLPRTIKKFDYPCNEPARH